jgi:uncharacterized protein YifN (PemK superfamily)
MKVWCYNSISKCKRYGTVHKSFLVRCLNNYAQGTINFVSINSKTRKSNKETRMHHATSNYSIQLQTLFFVHLLSWVRIALDSTIHLNLLYPVLFTKIYTVRRRLKKHTSHRRYASKYHQVNNRQKYKL